MHKYTLRSLLHHLGLPFMLVDLIGEGRLHEEIEKAYAELDVLNERLDAWEARNPELARKVPWYEGREAWKAAGRPRPDWYEVLRWYGERIWFPPITRKEVDQDLLNENTRRHRARAVRRTRHD